MSVMADTTSNRVMYLREDDYIEYLDTTTSGIICVDQEMRIKNLNREAERICGVDRIKVLGQRANEVFSSYGNKFLKIFSLSDYDDVYTTSLKIQQKDQALYLHINTLKLHDSVGKPNGLIVIMQDLSAVRAAIKQIQTTQMLLSLGELAAGVSHHIRTPLTTISGYLQVMLSRIKDDKYTVRRDVLELLLGEVSYINNVVKELVLFAKPPVQKEPNVNINRVLENSLLLVFKQLGGESIRIDKDLANLPVISADVNLMQQALVNIIQNAMEAMPVKGMLSVKSWLNSDVNMLVISIADTGTGIKPEVMARVFEPFYTTKLDRMGLGLPIANRIIGEHGGFINISPEECGGTRVHIYIPIFNDKEKRLRVVHQQVLNLQ